MVDLAGSERQKDAMTTGKILFLFNYFLFINNLDLIQKNFGLYPLLENFVSKHLFKKKYRFMCVCNKL